MLKMSKQCSMKTIKDEVIPNSHGLRENAYKVKADKKVYTPTQEHGSEI